MEQLLAGTSKEINDLALDSCSQQGAYAEYGDKRWLIWPLEDLIEKTLFNSLPVTN